MRLSSAAFLSLSLGLCFGLAACQPKDVKIERPNKFRSSKNSEASSLGSSTATNEDMFQYSLTRLQQMLNLIEVAVSGEASGCLKSSVLFNDSKNKVTTLAYQNCAVMESPESSDLSIVLDRGMQEITSLKIDSQSELSFANLQSLSVKPRSSLKFRINPGNKSLRKGFTNLSEDLDLVLVKVLGSENLFEFTFTVKSSFYEQVMASGWDSKNDGTQEVFANGYLTYDPAKKSLDQMYLKQLFVNDLRKKSATGRAKGKGSTYQAAEKKDFNQLMEVRLKYGEPNDSSNPALAFAVNQQDCWSLSGQGELKMLSSKNGYENFVPDKSKSKVSVGFIPFSLDNEKLLVNGRTILWPSCAKDRKNILPLNVAYGAIYIK